MLRPPLFIDEMPLYGWCRRSYGKMLTEPVIHSHIMPDSMQKIGNMSSQSPVRKSTSFFWTLMALGVQSVQSQRRWRVGRTEAVDEHQAGVIITRVL